MITNGMMIAHLCLNAPPEFENLFPLKTLLSEKIGLGVFVWCPFFEM